MKILHIIDGLIIGGAEKLLVDVVVKLKQRGHTVDVLLLDNTKTFLYKKLEESQSCNIFTLGSGFYNPFYIFKLIPIIKKYEIVHVHLFPAQYFVVLAKLLGGAKTKLIFTEHNTFNRRITKLAFRPIEKFIYSAYSKIICITPEVQAVLKRFLNITDEKLEVVTNGIHVDRYTNAVPLERTTFGYQPEDRILVMVAGFREQKDQDTVIRALTILPDNYKLLLVGSGERKSVLEQLVKDLNLINSVNFLGLREDVAEIYKMSDIAVLSSHWEGFGLAAVEAMASGTPLIASDVPGLAEVVNDGGMLFKKGDPKDLSKKVLQLEDTNFADSISKSGLKRANSFAINEMVKKLEKLYMELRNDL